jgi:glycosyltransferase involved in cell wall biosynthesis
MSPEVTAVITTHVRPIRVYEALASVCAETHADIEVVIVDDGGSFVAPGNGADLEFRLVRGAGLGVGTARNLGLAAAGGEYIIFLDDDDVAMPHRIARLISVARDRHATVCFGMTRRVIDGTTEVLGSVPTHLVSPGPIGFCDLLTCAPHVNAVLARTEALRAVGGFDTAAAHFDDWSAWLRIADRGASMWCVSDDVADWRIHDQGLSAGVLQGGAMKARLLLLFERLRPCLSGENARAVAAAVQLVQSADIVTYDDYVATMAVARETLHADGTCFGRPLSSHL